MKRKNKERRDKYKGRRERERKTEREREGTNISWKTERKQAERNTVILIGVGGGR